MKPLAMALPFLVAVAACGKSPEEKYLGRFEELADALEPHLTDCAQLGEIVLAFGNAHGAELRELGAKLEEKAKGMSDAEKAAFGAKLRDRTVRAAKVFGEASTRCEKEVRRPLAALFGSERAAARDEVRIAQLGGRTIRQAALLFVSQHGDGECPTVERLVAEKQLTLAQKDPWGRPYEIACNDDEIDVVSAGPDKKRGTADDIHAESP